jgi:hypothetical protein
VLVSGLASNAQLWNATGTTNGRPYLQSNATLPAGSNLVLVLEYYVPTRVPPANLTLTVQAGLSPVLSDAQAGRASLSHATVLPEGHAFIEFSAVPGRIYAIQYSRDLVVWRTASPALAAATNLVQWIDAGPPMTDASPALQKSRYYRVVLLPAN